MSQVFSKGFTLGLRLAGLAATTLLALAVITYRVNAGTDAALLAPIDQPVPFSHKHHVGDDGIDCRYCHVSVETSRFAGMPPLSTCMTCHSQLFTDQPVLAPLVTAYRGGESLRWKRVHELPDFAYFDHSIHVAKGVGCSTCHGRVDEMALTWRVASLDMQWCLECHRAPEQYLRPADRIFDMSWEPPADQATRGAALAKAYHVRDVRHLEMCSTCHR
jgi:hypothetical protein